MPCLLYLQFIAVDIILNSIIVGKNLSNIRPFSFSHFLSWFRGLGCSSDALVLGSLNPRLVELINITAAHSYHMHHTVCIRCTVKSHPSSLSPALSSRGIIARQRHQRYRLRNSKATIACRRTDMGSVVHNCFIASWYEKTFMATDIRVHVRGKVSASGKSRETWKCENITCGSTIFLFCLMLSQLPNTVTRAATRHRQWQCRELSPQ